MTYIDKQKEQEKEKQKEYSKVLQNTKEKLKQILLLQLIEAKKTNINIYLDDYKDFYINSTIQEYLQNFQSKAWQQHFNEKYRIEVLNYLTLNYYTTCSNAERIAKKQNEGVDDYKKQIALEKWELQRQKIQLQIEREKQKNTYKSQKEAERIKQSATTAAVGDVITIIFKICLYLVLAPFYILGFLLIGFFGGITKK